MAKNPARMNLHSWISAQRGRQTSLASALGIKPPTVSEWCSGIKRVPVERCAVVESFSGGAVTCETLRPDVAWARIPDASWPHPAGRPVIDVARPMAEAIREAA